VQQFRVPHRCVHPVDASFDYDVIDAAGKSLFQFVTGRSQQPFLHTPLHSSQIQFAFPPAVETPASSLRRDLPLLVDLQHEVVSVDVRSYHVPVAVRDVQFAVEGHRFVHNVPVKKQQ